MHCSLFVRGLGTRRMNRTNQGTFSIEVNAAARARCRGHRSAVASRLMRAYHVVLFPVPSSALADTAV